LGATLGFALRLPLVPAALVSKHYWLIIACDACDTVVDLDSRVPREANAVGVIEKCLLSVL
jgi:hypothetical protein